MVDIWHWYRRPILIGAGAFFGLLVILGSVAVVIHAAGTHTAGEQAPASVTKRRGQLASSQQPSAPATDVPSWDAIAPVTPAVSTAYPAMGADTRRDPDAFVRAFATELFTRDYTSSARAQLVAWAQFESAPLASPHYPRQDWTKVLVDSLTDLTWDDATDTPIPAEGPWLALQADGARDTVSDVHVALDPTWEQQLANGYRPADDLSTARDVTLTITRRVSTGGSTRINKYAVALAVQLGTSPRGGYGAAATNNYVIEAV